MKISIMQYRTLFVIVMAPLLLTACMTPLQEKLAEKSDTEQHAILSAECRKEANLPTIHGQQRSENINALCDEITKEMNINN